MTIVINQENENFFENGKIVLVDDNNDEYFTVINSSDLQYTEQWTYNRVLNPEKVKDIMMYYKNTKKYTIDSMLHFVISTDKYVCLDGNHRREALILLFKTEKINLKIPCYISKCKTENIDLEIREKFNIVNQNTPIPNVYIDIIDNIGINDNGINGNDTTNENLIIKKDLIEEAFNFYKKNYKNLYSKNAKCRRPLFNETTFKDLCNELTFSDINELYKQLKELNLENKKTKTKNITINMLNKCQAYDFYLFI